MQITLFYIPVSTETEAASMGRSAIDCFLAACANIIPAKSIYPWEGSIQNELEYILVLKTMPTLKIKMRDFINGIQSYEMPCILNWDVEVNDAYGEWI